MSTKGCHVSRVRQLSCGFDQLCQLINMVMTVLFNLIMTILFGLLITLIFDFTIPLVCDLILTF